jgi:DNA invertase Pin-like site-specific DNA recombinase
MGLDGNWSTGRTELRNKRYVILCGGQGTERIIAYEQVSTARQGASGLGIEAQRQAIEAYAAQRGATILARFTEVESGRNPDRPELGKALHLAKVTGAVLVIAKLDMLSRNAAFLLKAG